MRSILLLNLENLKKRGKQYFLVTVALVLSTLVLATALSLLQIIDEPFDISFNNLKASHILLLFDVRNEETDKVGHWFSEQAEVESVADPLPYIILNGPLIHRGKKIDITVQVTEHGSTNLSQDRLHLQKGVRKEHPGFGEIWLPNHFETTHGMQLGDSLGLPYQGELHQLKITAFVVDPHYLSAIFNPTRAWIAPGSLSFLAPVSDLNHTMMGIRLKDKTQIDPVWKRFNGAFAYSGSTLQYPLFKTAFSSFHQILSAVLFLFSLMALVISLLLIKATISSHVFADYRQIGVLKSLGFTPKNIIAIYLVQFGLLLLVAVPIGLLGAYFVIRTLIESVVGAIGISSFIYDLGFPFGIAATIVPLLVLVVAFISAYKAGKIRPVDAIRNIPIGAKGRVGKKTSKWVLSTTAPISAFLAVRFLESDRKSTWLLGTSLVGIIFIVVFSVNIANSFSQLHSNRSAWGFDNADVQVARNTATVLPLKHDQFMEMLSMEEKDIKTVTPFNYSSLSILSEDNKAVQEIFGKVYSGDISNAGLANILGEHPSGADGISLCIGTGRSFGKVVGDSILVFIEGQRKRFLITGLYQDVSTFGQGYRLHEKALRELNPLHEPEFYGVQLHEGVNSTAFVRQLQERFGETIKAELGIAERKSIIGLVTNVQGAVGVISIFFVLVMVVLINNDINIGIHQHTVAYAQLKSIGLINKQLRWSLVWRLLVLVAVASGIGIPLSLLLGPPIMNMLTGGIGLVAFPFVVSTGSIGAAVLLLLVFAFLSAWFASSMIKKVDPRIVSNI